MNRVLDILLAFFITLAVASSIIFALYRRPVITIRHIVEINKEKEKTPRIQKKRRIRIPSSGEGYFYSESFDAEKEIRSYILNLKEGILFHPALVFKVKETSEGSDIHILTFSEMEWQFVKARIGENYVLGKPSRVYGCGGFFDVNYTVSGILPPEVPRGNIGDSGILVVPGDMEGLSFETFSSRCEKDGFVFTRRGRFAGICSGSKFIDARELYLGVPGNCVLIYPEEEGNGTLQSKNR